MSRISGGLDAAEGSGRVLSRGIKRRGWGGRGGAGLATLEWLLIVGAVAGLAALATVLVARLVDDTAERTAGGVANRSAAEAAAGQVEQEARAAADRFGTWNEWSRHFTARCTRLMVLYSNLELTVTAEFVSAAANPPTEAEMANATIKCEVPP